MKNTIGAAFIFLTLIGYTQNISLSGVVISKEQGDPVPFPTILSSKGDYLGIGNSKGVFNITVDKSQVVSIVFTCVGFNSRALKVPVESVNNLRIELENNVTLLTEVVISPTNLLIDTLGISEIPESRRTSIRFGKSEYAAVGNKFKLAKKPAKIMSAHVHIGLNRVGNYALRCRIMSSKGGKPHEDLIEENILIQSNESYGWISFDLEQYNIWTREKNIILVIEILKDSIDPEKMLPNNKDRSPGISYIEKSGVMLIATMPGEWTYSNKKLISYITVGYL